MIRLDWQQYLTDREDYNSFYKDFYIVYDRWLVQILDAVYEMFDQLEKVLQQVFGLLARNLIGKARVRLGQGNGEVNVHDGRFYDWIVALRGSQIA
jgi:hypothetical protein